MTESAEQSNNVSATAAVVSNSNSSNWPDAPIVKQIQTYNHNSTSDGPINDINTKLDQLMEIIQTQNCQINELRNEVVELRKSHSNVAAAAAATAAAATTASPKPIQIPEIDTKNLTLRLTQLIEAYLSRYEGEFNQRLEAK